MSNSNEFTDEEYTEYGEEPLYINENFSNVVVLDSLPEVDEKKFDKLCSVILKIFSKYGQIAEDGLHAPIVDGMSTGYAFIEYESPEGAKEARLQGNNKKFGASHTVRVNTWEEFDAIMSVPDEFEPPEKPNMDNLRDISSWQLDKAGRDQFVLRYANETQIFWNDPYRKANDNGRVMKYGGEKEKQGDKAWTKSYVGWSPNGSFLATFHDRGILIWGGDDFDRMGRFSHNGVKFVDWSPKEKYIVTSNGQDREGPKDQNYCIQVWDVRSEKMMRGFDKGHTRSWPAFKWSHTDKYFARTGPDTISIYETPSMGLLDKKSIKEIGVQQIEWSPTQSILAYWVPEQDNVPAKVALLEIPSRKLIREKHLYSVSDVKMHWQSAGEYLCVKMSRKKTKKTTVQNFEIFRLNDKNIPVETLEVEDNVIAFAWEPNGHRFALIHGNPGNPDVSFYKLKKKSLEKIKTIHGSPANCLFWSPTGNYIVLAGLGDKNGQLDFVETQEFTTTQSSEHVMCTDVDWDASGRFVITSVAQPMDLDVGNFRATMENGYKLWSCSGTLLQTVSLDQFYQVHWRPRPKTLLSPEQVKEIKNDLKDKWWRSFEQEDDEIKQSQLSGAARERQEWKSGWKEFRARCDEQFLSETSARRLLRNGLISDDEDDEDDENYDEFENVVVEEISAETVPL